MSHYTLPLSIVIPVVISISIFGLIIYNRKAISSSKKSKALSVSISVFFISYILILCTTAYLNYCNLQNLNSYDLNQDGFFSVNERNEQQQKAMHKLSSDTAKNFAFITTAIYSFITAIFALGIMNVVRKFNTSQK